VKKIPSLFERDYEGTMQVYNKVVSGSEWVLNGEGIGTEKFDGTPCLINANHMYKRYDAKNGKMPPLLFIPCEEKPDPITGHWLGWIPIKGVGNEDSPFWEAFSMLSFINRNIGGTFELVGPKINGNPYGLSEHCFWKHGSIKVIPNLITFEGIKSFLLNFDGEGIVWHHQDGRMVKIKRRDFGFEWPITNHEHSSQSYPKG